MTAIFGILGAAHPGEMEAMAHRMAHRGAVFEIWQPAEGVHFGICHRSRHEVSDPTGLTVALDGVIENGRELGAPAATDPAVSDRRLVAELYRRHGLDSIAKLRGGFAVAIWDEAAHRVVLAVDFFGMRSLLLVKAGERWVFASELKALLAVADVASGLDPLMIRNANSKGSMNRYKSCVAGVLHVPPGQWMAIEGGELRTERFWQPQIAVAQRPDAEHVSDFRDTFVEVIRRKLASHERIGIATSAGINSAMVVGGIRHVAPDRTLHTFCTGLGRDDPELIGAAEIARHFKTHHHEYIFHIEEIPEWLPIYAWHLEHPYGREDMIASYCTAVAASGHVDVLFGGYAAENLVGGMPRHLLIRTSQRFPFLAPVLRDLYQYPRASLPPRTWLGRQLLERLVKGTFPPPNVIGTTPAGDEDPMAVLPDMKMFTSKEPHAFSRCLLHSLLGTIENTEFDRLHQAAGVLVDFALLRSRPDCLQLPHPRRPEGQGSHAEDCAAPGAQRVPAPRHGQAAQDDHYLPARRQAGRCAGGSGEPAAGRRCGARARPVRDGLCGAREAARARPALSQGAVQPPLELGLDRGLVPDLRRPARRVPGQTPLVRELRELLAKLLRSDKLRTVVAFATSAAAFAVANLLFADHLQPETYGKLALIVAILAVGSPLAPLGLAFMVVRERLPAEPRLLVRCGATSVLVAIGSAAVGALVYGLGKVELAIVLVGVLGGGFVRLASGMLQSEERFVASTLASESINYLLLAAALGAVAVGATSGIWPLTVVTLAQLLLAAAIWAALLAANRADPRPAAPLRLTEMLLLSATNAAILVLSQVERFAIPMFLGLEQLAAFAVLSVFTIAPFRPIEFSTSRTLFPKLRRPGTGLERRRLFLREVGQTTALLAAIGLGSSRRDAVRADLPVRRQVPLHLRHRAGRRRRRSAAGRAEPGFGRDRRLGRPEGARDLERPRLGLGRRAPSWADGWARTGGSRVSSGAWPWAASPTSCSPCRFSARTSGSASTSAPAARRACPLDAAVGLGHDLVDLHLGNGRWRPQAPYRRGSSTGSNRVPGMGEPVRTPPLAGEYGVAHPPAERHCGERHMTRGQALGHRHEIEREAHGLVAHQPPIRPKPQIPRPPRAGHGAHGRCAGPRASSCQAG